jgi:hypothetical protein
MQQITDRLKKFGVSDYAQPQPKGSIDFPAVLDLSNQALEQLSMTVGDRHKIPRATADQLGPFTGSPQHA